MVSNQQFRLKWNNHRNTVLQEFETLLHNNSFVDCTIGADGKYLKAHKIVLSACSPYLQNVFSEHFDKHPVILLKDVSFKELKCMIDYMYCGEVNISECELPSFLRTAQSLKIKGLAEDINEYDDSASDNEHQEISSLTENGRTVEPRVEIHDDEGPPSKRSAPSLIYSNFAGRKRKSPNAISSGVSKSSNNVDKTNPAPTSKTGGNVPSCADADNSDSNVCTTSKDSNVNKDDNDKKANSQDDLQEHKSKAVVKEEPLEADDDNSSYEFVNNPCDDSDPLNEDSESNCANSGKNFNEVSIANVSSCNEAEANDGDYDDGSTAQIKEELISEVVMISDDGTDEGKIRVRSTQELMPMEVDGVHMNSETAVYIVGGPMCQDVVKVADETTNEYVARNEIIGINGASIADRLFDTSDMETKRLKQYMASGKKYVGVKSNDDHCSKLEAKLKSAKTAKTPQKSQQPSFRKILPAPVKSTTTILPTSALIPLPVAGAAPLTPSTPKFAPQTNRPKPAADASPSSDLTVPASATYRMIAVSAASSCSTQTCSEVKPPLTPVAVPPEDPSQPILLSRVVLLNSADAQASTKQQVYTLPRVTKTLAKAKCKETRQTTRVQTPSKRLIRINPQDMGFDGLKIEVNPAATKPAAVTPVASKFRKIAPHPYGGVDNIRICTPCKTCFKLFTCKNELKKHVDSGCEKLLSKKKYKKNDGK